MNKRAIKVLLISNTLWSLGEGMLGPLYALFAGQMGGNVLDISWAWATYLVVKGLASIWVGKVSDRFFSKESLVITGFALNTLFTFGYLGVSSRLDLFAIEAGLGVAGALAGPTWRSLYSHYAGKKSSGWWWGLAVGSDDFVTALGIIIGGLIVAKLNFFGLFIIMGILQLVATVYQAKILYFKKGSKESNLSRKFILFR